MNNQISNCSDRKKLYFAESLLSKEIFLRIVSYQFRTLFVAIQNNGNEEYLGKFQISFCILFLRQHIEKNQ